jgi:hypothetical protein
MGEQYQKLKNTAIENTAFIVGSGPSLDEIPYTDFGRIQQFPVFAVNAAASLFVWYQYRINWVFKNLSAFRKTKDRCMDSRIKKIFTRTRNVDTVQSFYRNGSLSVVGFDEDQGEAFSKHTTATAAARVAHHVGHRRLVLVGMDYTPTEGKPYAKRLKYQRCIYELPAKQEEYFGNFEKDWQILKDELTDTEIINCSPVSKDRVFPYRPLQNVLKEVENE